MQHLKNIIKYLLFHSNILTIFHRVKNRQTLTVVVFHRVLPADDYRQVMADPEWNVTDTFFEQCLIFFKRHYNVIGLDELESFAVGRNVFSSKPSLLITFDDGWADNEEFALPLLKKYDVKMLLFVTTKAIGEKILSWQEFLYSAIKCNVLSEKMLDGICRITKTIAHKDTNFPESFIQSIQNTSLETRRQLLEITQNLNENLPGDSQMMREEQLVKMHRECIDMGTHGRYHEPVLSFPDPEKELLLAKKDLADLLNNENHTQVTSMSFPHGCVSEEALLHAQNAQYRWIFTGKKCLNALSFEMAGKTNFIFGRLNINQSTLSDRMGGLKKELLAFHLFNNCVCEIDETA